MNDIRTSKEIVRAFRDAVARFLTSASNPGRAAAVVHDNTPGSPYHDLVMTKIEIDAMLDGPAHEPCSPAPLPTHDGGRYRKEGPTHEPAAALDPPKSYPTGIGSEAWTYGGRTDLYKGEAWELYAKDLERQVTTQPDQSSKEFVNAMFSACCYLDRAIPVQGYPDNAARVRAATDEILRLRAAQPPSSDARDATRWRQVNADICWSFDGSDRTYYLKAVGRESFEQAIDKRIALTKRSDDAG